MATSKSTSYNFVGAALEVRFAEAYMLWDNAGKTWARVAKEIPGLELKKAEPRNTIFNLHNRFELQVELNRAAVLDFHPDDDLEELKKLGTTLFEATTAALQITHFTRVGLRLTYGRDMDSLEEAAKEVLLTGALRVPTGAAAALGDDGAIMELHYLGRWETKTSGVMVAIRSQGEKVGLDVPLNLQSLVEVKHRERFRCVRDVDYYTVGVIPVEQLRPRLWVEQAAKVGRRALRSVLEDRTMQ